MARYLGASRADIAALLQVAVTAIDAWLDGNDAVPEELALLLDSLEDTMNRAVEEAVEAATHLTDAGPVVLWRYRSKEALALNIPGTTLPLGSHAMMLQWAADAIADEGVRVSILWKD